MSSGTPARPPELCSHREMGTERKSRKTVAMLALLALCVLWSLSSLRSEIMPGAAAGTVPPLQAEAMQFASLAAMAAGIALGLRRKTPGLRTLGIWTAIGLALFVAPALLVHLADRAMDELTRVALFSLVPVAAVVLEPAIGAREGSWSNAQLVAALGAVAGTLPLFPVSLPASVEAAAAWGAVLLAVGCVASANCWAVRAAERSQGAMAWVAAIASGTAAVGFAAASAGMESTVWQWSAVRGQLAWSAVVDLPALALLFWLMRRCTAVQMTARFVLAPLIASLLGLILLQPSVSPRAWLGLALQLGGTGWLVLGFREREETGASPLRLNS
jgi:drug/metabolite transporter (DMT)-like permease